jgi:hypothetical protein
MVCHQIVLGEYSQLQKGAGLDPMLYEFLVTITWRIVQSWLEEMASERLRFWFHVSSVSCYHSIIDPEVMVGENSLSKIKVWVSFHRPKK